VDARIDRVATADIRVAPVRMIRVRGTVQNRDGSRVNRGVIRILRQRPSLKPDLEMVAGPVPVSSVGAFEATVAAHGDYLIAATAGSPWERPGIQQGAAFGRQVLDVKESNLEGVPVWVSPGASVFGRVVVDAEAGTLPAMRVFAEPLGVEDALLIPRGSTAVAPDMTFTLMNVFGPSRLSVDLTRNANWELRGVFLDSHDVTDTGFEGSPAARIGPVTIVLHRASGATSRSATPPASPPRSRARPPRW
jgi:hypothetical protein